MIDNYITYQDYVVSIGGKAVPARAEYKLYNKELDFSAVIDRADKFQNKIMVSDYKSDNTPKDGKHDDQLLLYTYLLEEETPGLSIDYIGVFFLKHDQKVRAKPVDREQMKNVVKWVKKLKADIESKGVDPNNFPATPNNLCGWCSHAMCKICIEGVAETTKNDKITEVTNNDIEILDNIPKKDSLSQ